MSFRTKGALSSALLISLSLVSPALAQTGPAPAAAPATATTPITGRLVADLSSGETFVQNGASLVQITNEPWKTFFKGLATQNSSATTGRVTGQTRVTVAGRVHDNGTTMHALWTNAFVALDGTVYPTLDAARSGTGPATAVLLQGTQVHIVDVQADTRPQIMDGATFTQSFHELSIEDPDSGVKGFLTDDNVFVERVVPVVLESMTGNLGGAVIYPTVGGSKSFQVVNDPFATLFTNAGGSTFDKFTTVEGLVTDMGNGSGYIRVTSANATTNAAADVRDGPSATANLVVSLPAGTPVTIVGGNQVPWCEIQFLNFSGTAFVQTTNLDLQFKVPAVLQTFTGKLASPTLGFESADALLANGTTAPLWADSDDAMSFLLSQAVGRQATFTGEVITPSTVAQTVIRVRSIFGTTSAGNPVDVVGVADADPKLGWQSYVVKSANGTTATIPIAGVTLGTR